MRFNVPSLTDKLADYQTKLYAERIELLRLTPVRNLVADIIVKLQEPDKNRRISAKTTAEMLTAVQSKKKQPEEFIDNLLDLKICMDDWIALQEAAMAMPADEVLVWSQANRETTSIRNEILEETIYIVGEQINYLRLADSLNIEQDLESVGLIELIRSMESFDTKIGKKFESLAAWNIRYRCISFLANNTVIKVPEAVIRAEREYRKVHADMAQALGREPSIEELAERLGMKAQEVDDLAQQKNHPTSLDQQVGGTDDEPCLLHDLIGEEASEPFDRSDNRDVLDQILMSLSRLTSKEAQFLVFRLNLFEDSSLKGTAQSPNEAFEDMRKIAFASLWPALK